MTKTNGKRVVRESAAVYMGRPVCFEITGASIVIWPKGTSKRYSMNLATAYVHAKAGGGRPVRSYQNGKED